MSTANGRTGVVIFALLLVLLTFKSASAQDNSRMIAFDPKIGIDAPQTASEPKSDVSPADHPRQTYEPANAGRFEPKSLKRFEPSDSVPKDKAYEREAASDDPPNSAASERFHWKPAIAQSLTFLGIQHGFRMIQRKTTREFEGKFFKDWGQSVRNLKGWRDGDSTFVNYIAHPMQGSLTGRIFVNNSDKAKKQQFGMSKEYWRSRGKAFVWSAVWSVQFEIGPLSEASIGNVGLRRRGGRRSTGYVDYVITPTVGTGWLVGEDAIDRYVLKGWIEKKANGSLTRKVKILRTFLTPTTSVANILRWRSPWKRDDR